MLSARRRKNTMLYNYKYVSLWNINIYIYIIHILVFVGTWHFPPVSSFCPTSPTKSLMGSRDSSFFSSTMESVARDLVKALWLEVVTFRTNHSLQLGGEQLEVSLVWLDIWRKKWRFLSRKYPEIGIFYDVNWWLDWIGWRESLSRKSCFFLGEVNGVSGWVPIDLILRFSGMWKHSKFLLAYFQ